MSTRGIYGFYRTGITKASYNHSDSYPSWLGANLVNELEDITDQQLKDVFDKIIMVEEGDIPDRQIFFDELMKLDFLNLEEEDYTGDWYNALRAVQGKITPFFNGLKYMTDCHDFFNSYSCEYVYIINLDTMELEYYVGGVKEYPKNRYTKSKEECGCKLVCKIPISEIRKSPDKIIKKMEELEDLDV